MAARFSSNSRFLLVLLFLVAAGCGNQGNRLAEDPYLLRIGKRIITCREYLDALEIMKSAYPHEALSDEQVTKILKTRLLKQLTEELILASHAEALGLSVSEAEVGKAVSAVKGDYPEGAFEKTLLERSISFPVWEKRLKMSLLTEKIIDKELVEAVVLTADEVNAFYQRYAAAGSINKDFSERLDADFVKHLRREKALQEYPQWIEGLKQQYKVEFNQHLWEELLR